MVVCSLICTTEIASSDLYVRNCFHWFVQPKLLIVFRKCSFHCIKIEPNFSWYIISSMGRFLSRNWMAQETLVSSWKVESSFTTMVANLLWITVTAYYFSRHAYWRIILWFLVSCKGATKLASRRGIRIYFYVVFCFCDLVC